MTYAAKDYSGQLMCRSHIYRFLEQGGVFSEKNLSAEKKTKKP